MMMPTISTFATRHPARTDAPLCCDAGMTSPETNFPELIDAARHGDAEARARVLAAFVPRLQAYMRLNANGLVLSREWSLDLAQSVCADALGSMEGFGGDTEEQFRAWLYRIALNKIRMRYRHLTAARRDARRELGEGVARDADDLARSYGTVCTPSHNLSAKETVDRIEAAMEQLPEEQRQVLTMASLLEMSHREIAAELGKQEPAVRKTLSRARARLVLLLAMEDESDA